MRSLNESAMILLKTLFDNLNHAYLKYKGVGVDSMKYSLVTGDL